MQIDLSKITAASSQEPAKVPEIAPAELAQLIESGAVVQLLDVRAPSRLAGGTVDIGPRERFLNVMGSELYALADPAQVGLDPALPVVTICGHGHSSMIAAAHLLRLGWNVRSMSGGMAAWMQVVLPRELEPPPGFTRFVQFDRVGKGSLGYVLVSRDAALAVDVPRNTTPYEQAAAESGARIIAVADTHAHADYISGGPGLARRLSVPYYLHAADNVYPYNGTPGRLAITLLTDGVEISVGAGTVTVIHTPGHTEGSVTLVAGIHAQGSGAPAALTGDFIFIGSVGRPDLAGMTEEWSALLFASLARAKRDWPDSLRVYPAHYAGQSERNDDRSVGLSFGDVKARNAQLAMQSESEFTAWINAHVTDPPENYAQIKAINIGLGVATDWEAEVLESGRNECALR